MKERYRITGARATECADCHGFGYTEKTCAEMQYRNDPEFGLVEAVTLRIGSGCYSCGGTGQLAPDVLRRLL
jgi:hypothetical protein